MLRKQFCGSLENGENVKKVISFLLPFVLDWFLIWKKIPKEFLFFTEIPKVKKSPARCGGVSREVGSRKLFASGSPRDVHKINTATWSMIVVRYPDAKFNATALYCRSSSLHLVFSCFDRY